MRLCVHLKTDKIPVAYHFLFVSYIKSALEKNDASLVTTLYKYKQRTNKKSKDFTFAVFLHDYEKMNDDFIVNGEVQLTISSNDYEFILYLYNGLLSIKQYQYKTYEFERMKIELVKETLPTQTTGLFQTLSPIVIKGKDGKELAPLHSAYEKELNYIANQIIHNAIERNLYEPLIFQSINLKKVIVKQKHKSFSSLNSEGILYVEGYKGLFRLKGNQEDLALLTQLGIGFRRNQGFGCLQFVSN